MLSFLLGQPNHSLHSCLLGEKLRCYKRYLINFNFDTLALVIFCWLSQKVSYLCIRRDIYFLEVRTSPNIHINNRGLMKEQNTDKASILIIYTGGTIGMMENPSTGCLRPLDFTYLEDELPELKKLDCQVRVKQLDQPIDSSSISPKEWKALGTMIEKEYDAYDGFVILHGTDTMSYTASALSFMFRHLAKPIILTGSQLPVGRLRTDGKENLITAIEIASEKKEDGSPRVQEVCVFFNNYLMRGNRTCKVSSERFKAFKSYNYPELAYVGIDIRYNDSFIRSQKSKKDLIVYKEMNSNVVVLKIFPGMTPDVIKAVLSIEGLRGVVLETFGSGNAPMSEWFIQTLKEAINKGVLIINVTQCDSGRVDMKRYETGELLADIGVICGYDITTEAALTKMMILFGQEDLDLDEISFLLANPLRGEFCIDRDNHELSCWTMIQGR